jgi:serine protease Do
LPVIALSLRFECARANADIPADVRDVFESMLDNLEPELQAPFRVALEKNTPVVEMTPEQFRKFRDNPFNPFEGLDEIDASDEAGNIALKFELPSLRTRPKGKHEKQNRSLIKHLKSIGRPITKSSEVTERGPITCLLSDGRKIPAKLRGADKVHDVALLEFEAKRIEAIQWSDMPLALGQFLLAPDQKGEVIAIGNCSVTPRSTKIGEQAFLGVKPETTTGGVLISDVRPGTASFEAGLRNGDIIVELDRQPVRETSDLVFQIRQREPGDQVTIKYISNGVQKETSATLAGNLINGERAARFKMMNRLGAIPSRRSSGFPNVFQHDMPIFPEHCGGPVLDLDGNAVGLNIARNGRAATYALPVKQIQELVEELERESVAVRDR